MDTSIPALPEGRRRRRQYSSEFRADPIKTASQPGVSVAAVALANGMNANLLRRWIKMAQSRENLVIAMAASLPVEGFVPLSMPSPGSDRDVRI